MKKLLFSIQKNAGPYLKPLQKLIPLSLAVWFSHIFLRVLLLFRSDPYGFPFVSKPDWFIFHAVCLDFLWITKALVFFAVLAALIIKLASPKASSIASPKQKLIEKIVIILAAVFHAVILPFTILDNEIQRFLGSHLSFGLLNTYSDTSSVKMFWDYAANDYSVPFLQFFVLGLILPFTYGVYRLLCSWLLPCSKQKDPTNIVTKSKNPIPKTALAMFIFYTLSYLFIYHIWTGNARMAKLRPVVSIVYRELFFKDYSQGLTPKEYKEYGKTYQKLWQQIEGDSLWAFSTKDDTSAHPLYRIPTEKLLQSKKLQEQRAQKPNFIVVFLESHRGLNTGFLNPDLKPSPTPFFDSLAQYSRVWERMHTSGLPTTGGLLSSHTGLPHHSKLSQATDLAHVSIPSYASVLKDSGYTTHYFSAADPAWDNLGVWMAKWYNAQHYDRTREDDSTFFIHTASYILDTLAKQETPFLTTIMTRSNHYPFNFAAGMTDEDKQKPLIERINITMNYTDRQLARFIRSIQNEPWFQNTYLIVLADHGFPLGENGVSTMNGGGFSNATWIPFLVWGQGIQTGRDTVTTAQIDIAPTILELAGIAAPNYFMGHNLLRGFGSGLSLGAYSRVASIGLDGYRLITKYPLSDGNTPWLFGESDTHQKMDLASEKGDVVEKLKKTLDTLILFSDYSLEKGM